MKFNNITKTAVATTSALAFALTAVSGAAVAGDKKAKEKCYGVVAKGMNDCGTSSHSCAGQAKVNHHGEEWMYVTKGLCKRIAGGKLKPSKA
ncbi:MAG: DUF2282 domain-containing protein [Kordiimonadaceae bacterium]|nr:DUF2282 domain-containing protein [Kordiimonadaceae bacterium]